jgi:putative restriction endonuclease
MATDKWTREQTIVALNLYYKIPFNKVSSTHLEIIKIAQTIGRSANSVKMKIGNFGSFDPELKRKGIVGLGNTSKLDEEVWNDFNADKENLAYQSELLISKLTNTPIEIISNINLNDLPIGRDREALVRVRVNQNFFRSAILSSYNLSCCITGLKIPELLVASHINPWATDKANRLNFSNGLCLNSIHDKAFDKGIITITPDYKVMISKYLMDFSKEDAVTDMFLKYNNKSIKLPDRDLPRKDFLNDHYNNIFIK